MRLTAVTAVAVMLALALYLPGSVPRSTALGAGPGNPATPPSTGAPVRPARTGLIPPRPSGPLGPRNRHRELSPGAPADASSGSVVILPRPLAGVASWYCLPGRSACAAGFGAAGLYAAACPALRAALGRSWRGKAVTVAVAGRAPVRVRLIDSCAAQGRLIDLYASSFRRVVGSLGPGTARVRIVP